MHLDGRDFAIYKKPRLKFQEGIDTKIYLNPTSCFREATAKISVIERYIYKKKIQKDKHL